MKHIDIDIPAEARADLLARGVVSFEAWADKYGKYVSVASSTRDRAEDGVREVLGEDFGCHWSGQAPMEVVSVPTIAYRDKGGGLIRLYVRPWRDYPILDVRVAETDERVVVLAYGALIYDGERAHEIQHVDHWLDADLGDRTVVCGFRGEVVRHADG